MLGLHGLASNLLKIPFKELIILFLESDVCLTQDCQLEVHRAELQRGLHLGAQEHSPDHLQRRLPLLCSALCQHQAHLDGKKAEDEAATIEKNWKTEVRLFLA